MVFNKILNQAYNEYENLTKIFHQIFIIQIINYKYDNRVEAGEWVNNNIAINSHIGITFPPTNYDSIPFRFHKYNLTDVLSIKNDRRIPEYIVLVNRDIHIDIKDKYKLVNTFIPKSILGYRPVLKGEVAAIYAKTIKIYKKSILQLNFKN